MNVDILYSSLKNKKIDLKKTIKKLGAIGINSILIEGGSKLIASSIKANIADKICFFYAPKFLAGNDGNPICYGKGIKDMKDAIVLKNISFKIFDDNFMIEGYFN